MTSHGRKYRTVREVQSACCAIQVSIFPGLAQKFSTPSWSAVVSLAEREKKKRENAAAGCRRGIAHRRLFIFEDLPPGRCSRDRKLPRLARSGRARDLAHAWSPPIAVLSVQESVSGASCTSSGGSSLENSVDHRVRRERVGTTRASVITSPPQRC